MAGKIPPSTLSAALGVGTSLIGALLAYQQAQQTLLYAFLLAGLFTLASLMFSKGEAEKKEVA